jgi:hypothetical protein
MTGDWKPPSDRSVSLLRAEDIPRQIRTIRGHRVLLDADLVALYGVPTKVLVQAVKRNLDRFPEDLVFDAIRA